MSTKNKDIVMNNKIFAWIALATVAVLSVPFVSMQFSEEVNWSFTDFLVVGFLLFGGASLFVHVARVAPRKYRALIGIGFAIAIFAAWVHLAVGIVDTWPLAGS